MLELRLNSPTRIHHEPVSGGAIVLAGIYLVNLAYNRSNPDKS